MLHFTHATTSSSKKWKSLPQGLTRWQRAGATVAAHNPQRPAWPLVVVAAAIHQTNHPSVQTSVYSTLQPRIRIAFHPPDLSQHTIAHTIGPADRRPDTPIPAPQLLASISAALSPIRRTHVLAYRDDRVKRHGRSSSWCVRVE